MNDIEKYTNDLLRNAQKHLKRSLDETGGEALHDLRIEIKKIHALLHLFSYCYGYGDKQDKKFEKLFKRAGKIRDLQLLIHQLEKQIQSKGKNQKDLLEKLKQQLSERSKRFRHRYRHHEAEAFEKTFHLIHDCLLKSPEKEAALYFIMMKEKISTAVNRLNPSEKQIHHLRINIKTLKYNLALSHNVEVVNLMDEKLLDKWEKLLGKWHDAVQLAKRLEKIKTEMKPELRNELKGIRKIYINRSKSLLKEFSECKPVNTNIIIPPKRSA